MKMKNIKLIILILLLIILSSSLYVITCQNIYLHKNIDLVFTNAVSESMKGLSLDDSKLDLKQKAQCYYQTLYNLNDALEVFLLSSYKKHTDLYKTLSRLYIYLLDNENGSYEIDDKQYIFDFLGRIMFNPNDTQSISSFNSYLDIKSK